VNDTIGKIGMGVSALFTGIIGLAILAVVLSNGSNTVNVIQAFFSGLTSLLTNVITPVQGGSNVQLLGGATSSGSSSGGGGLGGILGGLGGGGGGGSTSGLDSLFGVGSELGLGSGGGSSGGSSLGGLASDYETYAALAAL
jgi:PRD1 phage membrane DNA delivery